MSNDNQNICTCGCCDGAEHVTPFSVENKPGLSALHYRVGTHSSFKESMLRSVSGNKALTALSSRSGDDMAIATLDAWATVLDVLTFYQERIINEGYLRTATERFSIVELARLISYRPGPGVAAGTFLKFSMNESPGAPPTAIIPVGTKVQSIPEQAQLPQVFETIEQIEARVEWNAIQLQTKRRIIPGFGDTEIYLQGINTGLQPGDGLLMIGDERNAKADNENWDFRKVKSVMADTAAGYTKITWSDGLGYFKGDKKVNPAHAGFKVFALRQRASLFGYNAPDFRSLSGFVKKEFIPSGITGEYYNDINFSNKVFTRTDASIDFTWNKSPGAGVNEDHFSVRWSGFILSPFTGLVTFFTNSDDGVKLWVDGQVLFEDWHSHGAKDNSGTIWLQAGGLYSFRLDYFDDTSVASVSLSWSAPGFQRATIQPQYFFLPGNYTNWPGYTISAVAGTADTIYLDSIYSKIIKGSWIVLVTEDYSEVYKVENNAESGRSNFTLATKSTALKISGENLAAKFNDRVRDAAVYGQSEELEIADTPVTNAIVVNGKEIILEKRVTDLAATKPIIISGKRMRLLLLEGAGHPEFIVAENSSATRKLSPGDSLILLNYSAKPDDNGNTTWLVKDNTGLQGKVKINGSKVNIIDSAKSDEMVTELHTIEMIKQDTDPKSIVLNTILVLKEPVTNYYDPFTVVVYANVAAATHGETRQEVLGSGDGSQRFQKFELKQAPLTFVSAATASGTKTTLQVRVNDILWKEADTLYGLLPDDKVYVTNISDNGKVTVAFGDGITGARLPTGTENVRATYRVGIGTPGLLHAGQLSMLLTPQLGVNGVTNPLDTTGAADPESRDDARQNAPLTVLTLDRIVSVADFENFTRAFTGIGKARAEMIWSGEKQVVSITVAASDQSQIDKNSSLYKSLVQAVKDAGHSNNTVYIENYHRVLFSVNAAIKVDSTYLFENVKNKVVQLLKDRFSFDARDFGQDVTPAEIIATIQQVEGVVFTRLLLLKEIDPFTQQHFRLLAGLALLQPDGKISPAELLVINSNEIYITEIVS